MLDAQLVDRIGWTLIHSVWQIVLLAYVVAFCNRFLFRHSANLRYSVGCLALVAMVVFPCDTLFVISPPQIEQVTANATSEDRPPAAALPPVAPSGIDAIGNAAPSTLVADIGDDQRAGVEQLESKTPLTTLVADASETSSRREPTDLSAAAEWRARATSWLQPVISPIAIAWLVGVLVLSARPLFGLYTVFRLRRVGRSAVPDKIEALVRRLCVRMRIDKTIEVAESGVVQVPAVIGSLRPLLLLPATAITGLTPQQLEAVIAHELAHVRRHDFIINVLQTIVETLIFYHPAVWWVSAMVRRERENCCDDIAVAVCSDRAVYATTLVVLDEMRGSVLHPVVAATGGSLLQRIPRIAGCKEQQRQPAVTWLASVLLFVALLVVAGSVVTVTRDAVAEQGGQTNVRLKLREHDGNRLTTAVDFQSVRRDYQKAIPKAMYTSDKRGNLNIDLAPGKHSLVTRAHMPNATVIELNVPAKGLRKKVKLNPKPAGHPGKSGYPVLDVIAEVRQGKRLGEEFVVLTISNNKDEPYTLHENDLTFTNDDMRVFPPKSQQQAGLVIPAVR